MKGNEHLTVRQQFYVRMAQDFSTRYLTVDGHGNFGSVDGDGAAAYLFMGVVCDTVSMTELPTIEAVFVSKVQQKQPSKN